jgi:hypothetical protein
MSNMSNEDKRNWFYDSSFASDIQQQEQAQAVRNSRRQSESANSQRQNSSNYRTQQTTRKTKGTVEKLTDNIRSKFTVEEENYLREYLRKDAALSSELKRNYNDFYATKSELNDVQRTLDRQLQSITEVKAAFDEAIDASEERIKRQENRVANDFSEVTKSRDAVVKHTHDSLVELQAIQEDNAQYVDMFKDAEEEILQRFTDLNTKLGKFESQLNAMEKRATTHQNDLDNLVTETSGKLADIIVDVDNAREGLEKWQQKYEGMEEEQRDFIKSKRGQLQLSLNHIARTYEDIESLRVEAQTGSEDLYNAKVNADEEVKKLQELYAAEKRAMSEEYSKQRSEIDIKISKADATLDMLTETEDKLKQKMEEVNNLLKQREALADEVNANFQKAESVAQTLDDFLTNSKQKMISEVQNTVATFKQVSEVSTGSASAIDTYQDISNYDEVLRRMAADNQSYQANMNNMPNQNQNVTANNYMQPQSNMYAQQNQQATQNQQTMFDMTPFGPMGAAQQQSPMNNSIDETVAMTDYMNQVNSDMYNQQQQMGYTNGQNYYTEEAPTGFLGESAYEQQTQPMEQTVDYNQQGYNYEQQGYTAPMYDQQGYATTPMYDQSGYATTPMYDQSGYATAPMYEQQAFASQPVYDQQAYMNPSQQTYADTAANGSVPQFTGQGYDTGLQDMMYGGDTEAPTVALVQSSVDYGLDPQGDMLGTSAIVAETREERGNSSNFQKPLANQAGSLTSLDDKQVEVAAKKIERKTMLVGGCICLVLAIVITAICYALVRAISPVMLVPALSMALLFVYIAMPSDKKHEKNKELVKAYPERYGLANSST